MAAPKKYPDELRERATRLTVEARQDPGRKAGAIQRIGEQLGINPETLRGWVKQAEIDAGERPGTTSVEAARIAELERENRELRPRRAVHGRAADARRGNPGHPARQDPQDHFRSGRGDRAAPGPGQAALRQGHCR